MKAIALTVSLLLAALAARCEEPNYDWDRLALVLAGAIGKARPSTITDDDLCLVAPTPISISVASTVVDAAETLANYVPFSDTLAPESGRLVSTEYAILLNGVVIPETKSSPEYLNAERILFDRAPLGALLRSKYPAKRVSTECLDYLRSSESLLMAILEKPYEGPDGPHHFVDAVVSMGVKARIQDALRILSKEDMKSGFWKGAMEQGAMIRLPEWTAEAETTFLPMRQDWMKDEVSFWVTMKVDQAQVDLQILLPLIQRPWLNWELFQRTDWSWNAEGTEYRGTGLPLGEKYSEVQKNCCLPSVPTHLVIVRGVNTSGDMSSQFALSQWTSAMRKGTGTRAVVAGVIARKLPFRAAK